MTSALLFSIKIHNLGPNKLANVLFVRGIIGDWKYVYFIEYDKKLTKERFNEVILSIELLGIHVLCSTCDQGPRNESLAKSLGVTNDKPYFTNPMDPTRNVYWLYDPVHLYKSFRNNTVDHVTTLADGRTFCKKDFVELIDHCKEQEMGVGNYLKDLMVTCVSSDRQTVDLATELLKLMTASLFRRFFPNDQSKLAAADAIEITAPGHSNAAENLVSISTAALEVCCCCSRDFTFLICSSSTNFHATCTNL